MGTLVNPYIAGAPVTEARMFFGREDVFQWIENSIAGQYADHILVIHGQRRVGKTSVLKQLGNRLPRRFIPVFFDLQGRTHTTLDRFLWWLAREIVRVLKQERGIEFPLPDKDAFAADIEFFEHRFLPDLKPVLGTDTLLLTFDEFDNLEESEIKEELARPLIDYLRRLMGNTGLNFIFSIGSSGRKLENMQAAYTEFFKAALYKKISFLNEDQTRGLVTRPVEELIEYDRRAVTRIFQVAGGHPYFTQLTCHELFAKCQRTEERHIHEPDVESVLEDVIERGTVNLKFVWDEASDIEKWGLAALAQLDKTDNRLLTEYLRKQRVRFSETDLTSGLLHLREKDILTRENRFVIHLMKLWLQKNRPMEQAREELTEVNPIANRYIEIGLEFRDAGLYDKAIESFKEALAISKDNIQAQVNIALTYMDQKSYSSAVIEFEKALAMDDEEVSARAGLCEAHLALGDTAMQKGRAKEAVQSYQRVLAINAEHTEARQRMAELARHRAEKALIDGKDEEALSAFTEALKFTPEDPNLIARVDQVRAEKNAKVLAALLVRSGKEAGAKNWDKAIAGLNEALQIAPDDESILNKIKEFKERQLKDRLEAILFKADQAEKSNRWDVAIAALKEYLSLKADDTRIQKRLADLIEARHSAWLKAILTRSEQAVAYQKWDEAFNTLNEVLSLEPENAEIRKKLDEVRGAQRTARLESILKQAEQAAQAGKWDEAIDALKNGIAIAPEDGRLQAKLAQVVEAKRAERLKAGLRLAETAAVSGKWNVAIQSLNELLAVEPDNREVQKKLEEIRKRQRESRLNSLRTQARAMVRAERFDEALSAWGEYLRLEPDDPQSAQAEIDSVKKAQVITKSYAEAQRAYAKKNYDRAVDLLKGIISEDENYKDASSLLAESIELRRTRRMWWQSKFLWGGVGSVVLFAVAWFLFQSGLPLMNMLLAPTTAAPITTDAPATEVSVSEPATVPVLIPPSVTPTPLPFSWARVTSGQFLPRDQITAIVVDPNDSGVMYVGSQNAGIYKSIDGGLSWQPVQNGLERASISRLVIDPSDSNTLYASTQGDLYKTTDGGASWQELAKDREFQDGKTFIVVDPQDSQHLYYATNDVVYRSTDGGANWQIVKSAEQCPNSIYAAFTGHIKETGVLYASQWNVRDVNDCQAGLYRSIDGGATWKLIGLEGGKSIDQIAVGFDLQGNEVLYVTRTGEEPPELYVSHDGGESWQTVGEWPGTLLVDPDQPTTVYGGRYKSEDGGNTWKETITDPPSGWSAMAVLDKGETILGGTPSGLFFSTDGGASWTERNSGLASTLVDLRVDPSEPSTFYVNILGNFQVGSRLYRSTDNGRSWNLMEKGRGLTIDGDGGIYRIDGTSLLYSQDKGETWKSSPLPLADENPTGLGTNSAKQGAVFVVFSGQQVYFSEDYGGTWQESTMPNSENGYSEARFFFDRSQGQIGYLIPFFNAFRTSDAGITWKPCEWVQWSPLTQSILTIDPRDTNRIILAVLGNGLYRSEDGCQSWQESNSGLGSPFVNSVAINPGNPDTIYAGTDGGAYISTNGGETWGQVNDGLLGATVVYSIVVDKDGNVYAATPYGIFKLEGK